MTNGDRVAWTVAYRLMDTYMPPILEAATAGKVEECCTLFDAAGRDAAAVYDQAGRGGQLLLLAVYEIMETLFRESTPSTIGQNRPPEAKSA